MERLKKNCTLDPLYGVGGCQDQCQVAQDAIDIGPKGHVNDTPWGLFHALHLQRQNSLRALLEAAGRINFYVIALQETKTRKKDVRQLNDGILVICGEKVPSRNVGGVGFVVTHLSST